MRLFVCVLFAALVLPTGASAQSSVRPDPDSPAGVEYELPLDRARERAAGDDGPRRRGSRGGKRGPAGSAPLFGEGIGPAGGSDSDTGDGNAEAGGDPESGGGSSSSGGSRNGDGSSGGRGSGSQGFEGAGRGGTPGVSAATTAADKGGSDLGPTAAIVAAVLLAAGALGLLMRRTLGAR